MPAGRSEATRRHGDDARAARALDDTPCRATRQKGTPHAHVAGRKRIPQHERRWDGGLRRRKGSGRGSGGRGQVCTATAHEGRGARSEASGSRRRKDGMHERACTSGYARLRWTTGDASRVERRGCREEKVSTLFRATVLRAYLSTERAGGRATTAAPLHGCLDREVSQILVTRCRLWTTNLLLFCSRPTPETRRSPAACGRRHCAPGRGVQSLCGSRPRRKADENTQKRESRGLGWRCAAERDSKAKVCKFKAQQRTSSTDLLHPLLAPLRAPPTGRHERRPRRVEATQRESEHGDGMPDRNARSTTRACTEQQGVRLSGLHVRTTARPSLCPRQRTGPARPHVDRTDDHGTDGGVGMRRGCRA